MNVVVANRQRSVVLDLAAVTAFARRAGEICGRQKSPAGVVPVELARVEVSLVSDRRSAALHRQFLQIRGPTDVITFEHGEIVISTGTAVRSARAHGEPLEREVGRYIVHGLLHLRGYEDATPAAAAAMWRVQERVVRRLWPAAGAAAIKTSKHLPRR